MIFSREPKLLSNVEASVLLTDLTDVRADANYKKVLHYSRKKRIQFADSKQWECLKFRSTHTSKNKYFFNQAMKKLFPKYRMHMLNICEQWKRKYKKSTLI